MAEETVAVNLECAVEYSSPQHADNQDPELPDLHFSNLLIKMAKSAKDTENTDYFKTKHHEYVTNAETQFKRQYLQFIKNKRRWEEIADMDIEVKRRKTELDNVTKVMAVLDDDRAVKQLRYERAAKYDEINSR